MICDRPDMGPKGDIVYRPPSASRRHCVPGDVSQHRQYRRATDPHHSQQIDDDRRSAKGESRGEASGAERA